MRLAVAAVLLAGACRGTLSPLSNKLEIGQESYIVFAADGEDGMGDLFASAPLGGTAWQITFSRVDERFPSLSPDGVMLAFDRGRSPDDTATRSVVAMNLLNGAERQVVAPGVLRPQAIGWSADGRRIVVRGESGVLTVPAPPERGEPSAASAEDAARLTVRVGEPPTAEARACSAGAGVCVVLPDGVEVTLDSLAGSPVAWYGDSVAYLRSGGWVVHPLAGGHTRLLKWDRNVANPRSLTRFHAPR
ncbi:MAG: hypothetical protein OEW17_01355 [Gemmatimonadota bacterium]|nr:hypothetical protein [Gemmatimonadota bacterium]MDH4347429.1 hypothetical protein [Gemmatimonadota bacterium]MDH5282673.1 hypothetical protein [Gemmatimonadota bacterium]